MDYANMSETDIAFQLLQEKGEPMWYRDLIREIFARKHGPEQAVVSQAISEVYTLINMDSRFAYDEAVSKEEDRIMWGLAEWQKEAGEVKTAEKKA